jgi:hypothetical protein
MMSKKDFENVLLKYEKVKNESDIDWAKRKQEWLHFVQQFYDKIEQWLKPYVEQNKLKYNYHEISLTEEYIETYTIKVMDIYFAGQQVKVEPIGTLVFGTKGRIDMEGARGIIQFLLVAQDSKGMIVKVSIDDESKTENQEQKYSEWKWKIVLKEQRRIAYEEFNEENFFGALMEIING